ncbi:MAG: PspC domain-containing protein [Actinomycetota bacterium]
MTSDQEKKMDAQPQQARRLIRRTDDKMIAGVAGGLADYFGVDPVWFRLGFVAAVFLGGSGLLAYAVLWVVMPKGAGGEPSTVERTIERVAHSMRNTPALVGGALVILGVILVANQLLEWRAGVIWGFALIVFGVILFVQRDEVRAAEPAAATAVLPPAPPGDTAVLPLGAPPLPPGTAPSPPPRRVRERSSLGWMTLGGLFVVVGVVTLLDLEDVIRLTAGQYLAMAVATIGVGLLAGAWYGRARWLIVPGLVLIPFMLAASLIHVPFEGGVGDRLFRPTSLAAVQPEYQIIAGQMLLDLNEVPFGPGTYTIEATAVAGRILVLVPENVRVEIHAKAGAGQVSLFGQTDEGLNVDVRRIFEPRLATTSAGVLRLDLEAALGQVEVAFDLESVDRPFGVRS